MATEIVQEIITEPFNVYVAPVGTAFPALTTEESGFATAWTKLGAQVSKSYSEAGVTVAHTQTPASFQPAGSTVPRKWWRTDEGMTIALELADLTTTTYALIMDNATVTHVTGSPGTKSFQVKRGNVIHPFALLARGPSPEYENHFSQYQVPVAYQTGNPTPKYALKGGPAFLAVTFSVAEGEPNKFAEFVVQTSS